MLISLARPLKIYFPLKYFFDEQASRDEIISMNYFTLKGAWHYFFPQLSNKNSASESHMLSIFNYKLSEAKFGVIILELLFWDLLLTNTPATPASDT